MLNDAVTIFFGVKQCLNNVEMRHHENRSLENVSYLISSLISNFFPSEWRNFDQKDMRFLNNGEK